MDNLQTGVASCVDRFLFAGFGEVMDPTQSGVNPTPEITEITGGAWAAIAGWAAAIGIALRSFMWGASKGPDPDHGPNAEREANEDTRKKIATIQEEVRNGFTLSTERQRVMLESLERIEARNEKFDGRLSKVEREIAVAKALSEERQKKG